jgi:hypothetical protein
MHQATIRVDSEDHADEDYHQGARKHVPGDMID